jgi:hypothetical protein
MARGSIGSGAARGALEALVRESNR